MHSTLMTLRYPSQARWFLASHLWHNLMLYGSASHDAVLHPEYLAARGHWEGFHTDEIVRRELAAQVKGGNFIPTAVCGTAKQEATSA